MQFFLIESDILKLFYDLCMEKGNLRRQDQTPVSAVQYCHFVLVYLFLLQFETINKSVEKQTGKENSYWNTWASVTSQPATTVCYCAPSTLSGSYFAFKNVVYLLRHRHPPPLLALNTYRGFIVPLTFAAKVTHGQFINSHDFFQYYCNVGSARLKVNESVCRFQSIPDIERCSVTVMSIERELPVRGECFAETRIVKITSSIQTF